MSGMLTNPKQLGLFATGTFLGALVLALTLQWTTIAELNNQLAEQQRKVTGLTAYNKSLQQKMLHMVKSNNAASFYSQVQAQPAKVSAGASYKEN